ncbi:hypothetical protein N431DRAFT_144786 [Stipitochalara longipes BDJ]|nr:hypothetical protein N431DRAFT_144786 [Stipitochalara longipes BDJ]
MEFLPPVPSSDELSQIPDAAVLDPQEDLDKFAGQRLEGSYSWSHEDTRFANWSSSASPGLIWLYGAAEVGKSMLAAFIVEHLRTIHKNDVPSKATYPVVAYFFCQFGNEGKDDPSIILRSLLFQILRGKMQSQNTSFPSDTIDISLLSKVPMRRLWDRFQKVLRQSASDRRIYVVIDGIDECKEGPSALPDFLRQLLRISGRSPETGILITSRNIPYIQEMLDEYPSISLDQVTTVRDRIQFYVNHQPAMSALSQNYEKDLQYLAHKVICQKANSMFILAHLLCHELLARLSPATSKQDFRDMLDSLPSELDDMYGTMWQRASSTKSREILSLILVVARPLTLNELKFLTQTDAIALGTDVEQLHQFSSICGQFLKVIESASTGYHTISYTHQSAIDFVRKQFDVKKLHGMLAARCHNYVNNPANWEDIIRRPPLEYPVRYWLFHSSEADEQFSPDLDLDVEFFSSTSQLNLWSQTYWKLKHGIKDGPSNCTILHILAESGFYQLAKRLLQLEESRTKLRQDRPPPALACVTEQQMLNRYRACTNFRDSFGNLPLHWAASNGHISMLELLLPLTDDLDAVNFLQMTPLHDAASKGHYDICALLVRHGVNINSKARDARTVLQSAAVGGHMEIVGLLLREGVSIDEQDMSGATALDLAESNEQESVIRMLQDYDSRRLAISPLKQSHIIDGGFWGMVADFTSPPSFRYVYNRVSVDRMLSHETFDEIMNKAARSRATSFDRGDKSRAVRWLHLPANNMKWVEILMAKCFNSRTAANILKPEIWVERQHKTTGMNVHDRFIRPLYYKREQSAYSTSSPFGQQQSSQKKPDSSAERDVDEFIMIAIPYINWATEGERQKLNSIVSNVKVNKILESPIDERSISEKPDRYEKLVWTYLLNEHPLHIRRTLDQSYYGVLASTEDRDKDQVPFKFFKEHYQDEAKAKQYPVLMVDQLWLWVLNDNTVITSFPQRWTEKKKDILDPDNRTDVLDSMLRHLDQHAEGVRTGFDLARIIFTKCSTLCFDATRHRSQYLQFPEFYEMSIGSIADKEMHLFRKFSEDLNKERSATSIEIAVDETSFEIKEEIKQLELIKDVLDELNMIHVVFSDQAKVWQEFYPPTSRGARGNEGGSLMLSCQVNIERMAQQANTVRTALQDLLDLKSKQANVSEARSQRHQAEAAVQQGKEIAKQGKAIILFTIITIVFLPLSFMASFFAIQIKEFPDLTLPYVLKYMLPISAAISLPCIVGALNIELFSLSRAKLADLVKKKVSPNPLEWSNLEEAKQSDLETGLQDAVTTATLAKTQYYEGQSSSRSPYKYKL